MVSEQRAEVERVSLPEEKDVKNWANGLVRYTLKAVSAVSQLGYLGLADEEKKGKRKGNRDHIRVPNKWVATFWDHTHNREKGGGNTPKSFFLFPRPHLQKRRGRIRTTVFAFYCEQDAIRPRFRHKHN